MVDGMFAGMFHGMFAARANFGRRQESEFKLGTEYLWGPILPVGGGGGVKGT